MQNTEELNKKYNKYLYDEDYNQALSILKQFGSNLWNSDHWIIAQRAIIAYEMRNYSSALDLIKKAYEVEPTCPLVNHYYSVILVSNDKRAEAINIWKNLIDKPIEQLAYDDCGEGLKWANSLINDIKYELADNYFYLGNYTLALEYIQAHLKNRKRGQFSIRSKKETLTKLEQILNKINNLLND